jgi:hypothetical protein
VRPGARFVSSENRYSESSILSRHINGADPLPAAVVDERTADLGGISTRVTWISSYHVSVSPRWTNKHGGKISICALLSPSMFSPDRSIAGHPQSKSPMLLDHRQDEVSILKVYSIESCSTSLRYPRPICLVSLQFLRVDFYLYINRWGRSP